MQTVLLAVDETKGSLQTVEKMVELFCNFHPTNLVMVYVEKIEGKSLLDDLILSESEMQTLKESLKGSQYQEKMDEKAEKIVRYFSDVLSKKGLPPNKILIREGHPAEEILKAAKEEEAELIVIGSRSKRTHNLFMGSVSREVANNAEVSVLVVK